MTQMEIAMPSTDDSRGDLPMRRPRRAADIVTPAQIFPVFRDLFKKSVAPA